MLSNLLTANKKKSQLKFYSNDFLLRDSSSTSGCNSSTVGSFPSIFATVEGSCENSSDSEFEQEVE